MAGNKNRVVKKSSNACARCRRQKIKCSGSQPCDSCNKRRLTCIFDDRDQKVLVTKGYLDELQRRISRIEQGEGSDQGPFNHSEINDSQGLDLNHSDVAPQLARSCPSNAGDDDNQSRHELEDPESGLTNPLSAGPPAFTAAPNGKVFYFGTSSNWSFTRRVLNSTNEHLHREPLPTASLLFDGSTYDLGWDGLRTNSSQEAPIIPTFDHAIYLINAVKFRCGQLYHLFDEDDFMRRLHEFYSDPGPTPTGLWYTHFLIIIAFGKGFVQQKRQGTRPPGSEYVVKALQHFPDMNVLYREPLVSTEILCCLSLYLQCLDFRGSAHNYIGQAMRIALNEGMHTRMPTEYLGEITVQRCRRIWWTIYILDREMTSLMGLPQTISDNDVHTLLPTYPGTEKRTSGLEMHIKLSRIVAEISSTIYADDGRLNRTFLFSTKSALGRIAELADDLQHSFPVYLDRPVSGVSRPWAYLHLLYHQCIVLATRPLLFCFLKIRFESPATVVESLNEFRNVRDLIQMGMDSAQQSITVLHSLQFQGLLETFLPFDLDSVFVCAVMLLMGPAIDTRFLENRQAWVDKAYAIFDEIILSGNLVAKFRQSELQLLDEMLSCIAQDHNQRLPPISAPCPQTGSDFPYPQGPLATPPSIPATMSQPVDHDILPAPCSDMGDEFGLTPGLTTAQIMAVANSIESGDTDWMSNAMLEHSIW